MRVYLASYFVLLAGLLTHYFVWAGRGLRQLAYPEARPIRSPRSHLSKNELLAVLAHRSRQERPVRAIRRTNG